jgi:hypothetical protein
MSKGHPWIPQEDSVLLKLQTEHGTKWRIIAVIMRDSGLRSRTPRACMVRWYLLKRQQAAASQQPEPEPVKEATLI